MESEQFASLGDRMDFQSINYDPTKPLEEKQSAVEIARRLDFILFEEIIESSPIQSRAVIFDPKNSQEDKELLDSIRATGIITPITVRELQQEGQVNDPFLLKKPGERTFALVAGHRRVAAGQAAGLAGSYGVITNPSDDHNLITLVENMGRKELSTFERAQAIKTLQERKGLSENKTAELVGISQGSINRFINALKSPEVLKDLWREGKIGATAIMALKKHWHEIDQLDDPELVGKLQGLSQNEAISLRDQLGSGTSLKTALSASQYIAGTISPLNSPKQPTQNQTKPTERTKKQSSKDSPGNSSIDRQALMTAIRDVFPRVTKNKFETLFAYTSAYGNDDHNVLWAAAMFVSRGGKIDRAVDVSINAMSNRSIASLINRQLKITKLSVSLSKRYWKKNNDIKEYIKTVFR